MEVICVIILHMERLSIFLTKKLYALFVQILFFKSLTEQLSHGKNSSFLSAFYVRGTLLNVRAATGNKTQCLPFKGSLAYLGHPCQVLRLHIQFLSHVAIFWSC